MSSKNRKPVASATKQIAIPSAIAKDADRQYVESRFAFVDRLDTLAAYVVRQGVFATNGNDAWLADVVEAVGKESEGFTDALAAFDSHMAKASGDVEEAALRLGEEYADVGFMLGLAVGRRLAGGAR